MAEENTLAEQELQGARLSIVAFSLGIFEPGAAGPSNDAQARAHAWLPDPCPRHEELVVQPQRPLQHVEAVDDRST